MSPSNGMEIGVQAIVKVSVRFPNLFQHLHIQAQLKQQKFTSIFIFIFILILSVSEVSKTSSAFTHLK